LTPFQHGFISGVHASRTLPGLALIEGRICVMNFLRRWRNHPERGQEQLLVRLWTTNSMNADAQEQLTRSASKLAFDAKVELKSSLKYLSSSEIEETVTDAACSNLIAHRLRKHLNDGRRGR
jgi:hypothetical protein